MSLVRQLAGETAIYGMSNILSRVLHYVFLTWYLTRRITEETMYGTHQDLYAYMAFLIILFTYRMETAYFRMGVKKESESKVFGTAFLTVLTNTVFLTVILLLCAEPISKIFQITKSQYVVYSVVIITLDAIAAIPFARLRLQNRPIKFAVIKVINVVLNILFVLFFLEACPYLIDSGYTFFAEIYSNDNLVDLIVLSNVLASAVVLLCLSKEMFATALKFDSALFKRMFWYASPLVIVGIASALNLSSSVPLIKFFLESEDSLGSAGIYAAAAKLAVLLNLFTQAFNYAAEPFFFKRADKKDARRTYAEVALAFSMAACVGLLGILLYLDFVQYIVGSNYRDDLYIVPVLLAAYWFLGLHYNFSVWYKVSDKTHYGAIISVGGSVITLAIAIFLIPKFGKIAMAFATLACFSFMASATYLTGRKHYPIDYPIIRMLGYLLLAFCFFYVSEVLQNSFLYHGFLLFFVNSLIFAIYIGVLYRLEKQQVLTWIRS